jgi:hypothetical protein
MFEHVGLNSTALERRFFTVIMVPHGVASLPIEHQYLFLGREDYKAYRRKKLRILTGVYPGKNVVLYEIPVVTNAVFDYDLPVLTNIEFDYDNTGLVTGTGLVT